MYLGDLERRSNRLTMRPLRPFCSYYNLGYRLPLGLAINPVYLGDLEVKVKVPANVKLTNSKTTRAILLMFWEWVLLRVR